VITQRPEVKATDDDYDDASPISSSTVPSESTSEAFDLAAVSSTKEASEELDYNANDNSKPYVVKRIKKLQTTAGKAFTHKLDEAIFADAEDGKNLKLELLDKNGQALPANSWIRFNPREQEIYGLALEKDVSRHEFKLRATDSDGEYVDENVDVTVQQHKSFRSVNHEIYIQITLEKTYESSVDWEIRLIQGIVQALEDDSVGSIVVRDGELFAILHFCKYYNKFIFSSTKRKGGE
jgi:neurexin